MDDYGDIVFRTAKQILKNTNDAEDVFQNTFIKAYCNDKWYYKDILIKEIMNINSLEYIYDFENHSDRLMYKIIIDNLELIDKEAEKLISNSNNTNNNAK